MKFIFIFILFEISHTAVNVFHILKLHCKSGNVPGFIINSFPTKRELVCHILCSRNNKCYASSYSTDKRCYHHSVKIVSACTTPSIKKIKIFNKVAVSDCYGNGNYNIWKRTCNCNSGFYGNFCQYDACLPNPCKNFGLCHRISGGSHFSCICVGGYSGSTCMANDGRQITSTLSHSNHLSYGNWQGFSYCSHTYFVRGVEMRVDPEGNDDTAVNNVRIICQRPYDGDGIHKVKSGTAPDGNWHSAAFCSGDMYMVGFIIKNLKYQGIFKDDYGVTDLRIKCRSLSDPSSTQIVHPPGGLSKGDWGSWSNDCYLNSAVCGLNPKIEFGGSADKTGLNRIEFKCCKV